MEIDPFFFILTQFRSVFRLQEILDPPLGRKFKSKMQYIATTFESQMPLGFDFEAFPIQTSTTIYAMVTGFVNILRLILLKILLCIIHTCKIFISHDE